MPQPIAYLAYPTEIDYPRPVQKLIDAFGGKR